MERAASIFMGLAFIIASVLFIDERASKDECLTQLDYVADKYEKSDRERRNLYKDNLSIRARLYEHKGEFEKDIVEILKDVRKEQQ
jgi:hypothetical protein